MNRLNVLYLIRSWAFGGSHTIILLLMKHLPRERFNIVCVPFDTRAGLDEAFIREARKRDLPIAEDRIPWRSRSNWGRARTAIAELVEKHHIDLIHAHDTHSTVLVGIGRERWPCAAVTSAYGWWNSVLPLRRRVYQWVERVAALPRFDRVITVSQNMKQKVLHGGWVSEERVRVIHTGLDLAAIPPRTSREEVRRALGIPEDACVIGAVSRVSVEKGHRYLLDAAAALAPRYPNMRLLIIGDGPARPALEEQARALGIADRVLFPGFVEDLKGALSAMDIFAQPSIHDEGFPTSVLEAQVAGLPVVASDIGGTAETLDVGTTGLLAPPRDPQGLAAAIETLLRDPTRRLAMGRAASEWIARSFTLEHMVAQVAATYEESIEFYRAGLRDRPGS